MFYNSEIIQNIHEGVSFACENPLSFVFSCIMTFIELQNGLCQSIKNDMLRRVNNILYRNPIIVFGGLIQFDIMSIIDEESMKNMFHIHWQTHVRQLKIELYVEFENIEKDRIQHNSDVENDRVEVCEGMNSDSEEDFDATYEAVDEDENGDVGGEAAVENVVIPPAVSQLTYVPSFMRNVDLDAMHASEFFEYANIGVADPKDGEFRIGMEYNSRKSIVTGTRSYTISRGVDYNVYESEPQTFYAKYKMYGRGCDWFIQASLIQKKGCWKIRRYNGRHTCTMGTISQDHFKLDSDIVVGAIRPLVETNLSIKVKSIIAEVHSRSIIPSVIERLGWQSRSP
ncbi:hypothetical protein Ahy_A07g034954 [Arachis hypogaea]|uniref:Transposase MuDR plant domain-containing protein n=1 Tax=Arachis hypogaea TaxID=3818 RepID=A0A445CD62_ARAHY|nr:hypothetical protein Ahy_A07g034954 [Arachis hypogaea]